MSLWRGLFLKIDTFFKMIGKLRKMKYKLILKIYQNLLNIITKITDNKIWMNQYTLAYILPFFFKSPQSLQENYLIHFGRNSSY